MTENYSWRTGRSCVFKNNIHLVFVTKYRRGVFTGDMLDRLQEILAETCRQMEAEMLEFGGEEDHIHMLISCPPKLAVANLVGKLKGKSSYLLRREYWPQIKKKLWGNQFWSPSYCVVSCGGASLETVAKYIEEQRRPPDPKNVAQSERFTGRRRATDKSWLA